MPRTGNRLIYVMAYNSDMILFEGEYYNWADFHGMLNDVLMKVSETQESLYYEYIHCNSEDDLDLLESLI